MMQEMQRCPMCQAVMGGMGSTLGREDVDQWLQQQIQRREARVGKLECSRR